MLKNKLFLIFLLAFGIRLVGINHGLPYIFHPDEPTIVQSALGIRFDINPAHFDWPHLYIYLNYFVYMLFAKLRDVIAVAGYKEDLFLLAPIIWNDSVIFYLISRIITAVFGSLTVFPLYLTAKTMFNERTGLWAGLALAITPFHVWHSHYGLSDVPVMFFVAWALYYSATILFKNDARSYLWAGLFVGLAASTKYNGALAAFMVVLAHILRILSEKDESPFTYKAIENLIFSGLAAIFGFVLGTPFAVLDYKTFIRTDGPKGALWQFTNVGDVSFLQQLQNFFSFDLMDDLGYTFLILFVFGVVYLIWQRKFFENKDLIFLIVSGLFFLFYVSGLEKTRAHYFFIAYPAVLLGAVGVINKLFSERLLLVLLTFIVPLYLSSMHAFAYFQKDTRLELDNWLLDNRASRHVYYEGGNLKPLFENKQSYSTKVDLDASQIPIGSLFIVSDSTLPNYKLVKKFDNNTKRGPIINVYEIY